MTAIFFKINSNKKKRKSCGSTDVCTTLTKGAPKAVTGNQGSTWRCEASSDCGHKLWTTVSPMLRLALDVAVAVDGEHRSWDRSSPS